MARLQAEFGTVEPVPDAAQRAAAGPAEPDRIGINTSTLRLTSEAQSAMPAARRTIAPPPAPATGPGDDIDLPQLLGALWRGKLVILLCAFLAAAAGMYYAFAIAVPKYAATARLALQVRDRQVVDLQDVISGVSTEQASINTELEVIRSRGLIERLVTDMNLLAVPEFNARLRQAPVLSTGAAVAFVRAFLPAFFPAESAPTADEIRIDTARAVRDAIAVSSQKNTYLFDIRVTTENPGLSAGMANGLANIYLDNQIGTKFAATEYAVDWLSGRVSELELELKLKEDAVTDLRAKTELVSQRALEALNVRAKELRERLSEAQTAAAIAQANADKFAELVAVGDVEAIAQTRADPALSRLINASKRGNAEAGGALDARLDALVRRERASADRELSQRDALKESYDRIQTQIDAQGADLVRLNQLAREVDATRVLYETFLTRLKETSVQIGLQRADSRILSRAVAGELVQPQTARILVLAILLGGMLGAAGVLFRQFRHEGFRTAGELEQTTGVTVLGQIPKIPFRRRTALVEYLRARPASALSEAVRNLRTSVLLSHAGAPPQVIMSASSVPGEGKTTQAIALSHNLAGLGKTVLLVEGDIRRQSFKRYFRQDSPGSVVDVVAGKRTLQDAVLHDDGCGADVLMGGRSPVNAADLFSSDGFREFVELARSAYDFVIIDTPPVLVVPDARIAGRHVDAIIYTVNWDRTGRSQVADGLRQFSSVGLYVHGLVLAQVDPRGMKRYGYRGRYGTYSGYGRGYYDAA